MSDNKKYYLAFLYDERMGDGLHCTHCYFGTLNLRELSAVEQITDAFFRRFGPIEMPTVRFDRVFLFGPKNDIRVLATNQGDAFHNPFQELRDMFQYMALMKMDSRFRPHVTTPAIDSIAKPFTHYGLVSSGMVLRAWPVHEMD